MIRVAPSPLPFTPVQLLSIYIPWGLPLPLLFLQPPPDPLFSPLSLTQNDMENRNSNQTHTQVPLKKKKEVLQLLGVLPNATHDRGHRPRDPDAMDELMIAKRYNVTKSGMSG